MTPFEIVQTVASIATAIGVAIAAWQLMLTKQQEQAQFEDGLNAQYRTIASTMPLDALLGRTLTDDNIREQLRAFYNYFDLSNEQAFLFNRRRLRKATWKNWKEGIEENMQRPAIRRAWQLLEPDLDGSFTDLKRLIQSVPLPLSKKA